MADEQPKNVDQTADELLAPVEAPKALINTQGLGETLSSAAESAKEFLSRPNKQYIQPPTSTQTQAIDSLFSQGKLDPNTEEGQANLERLRIKVPGAESYISQKLDEAQLSQPDVMEGVRQMSEASGGMVTAPQEVAPMTPDPEYEAAMQIADQAAELDQAQKDEEAARQAFAQQKAAEATAARAVEKEKEIERAVASADENAAKSDDETVGGLNLRTAFAILLGGVKQGLVGGDNPALTMLDRMAEKEEAKRAEMIKQNKLTQEQALALEKHQLNKLKALTDMETSKTNNQLTKMKMAELSQKLGEKAEQLAARQKLAESGRFGITDTELQTAIPEDERALYVRSPIDNKFYRTTGKELAKQTSKDLAEIESSLPALERLKQINEEIGFDVGRKLFDRAIVGEANSLQQMAIGGLRVAIFGPGVITDNERRIAENVIRNPTKIFTIPAANRRVLESVIRKVRTNMRIKLRQAGAKIPLSENEKNIQTLMKTSPKKYPNTPKGRSDAANALLESGRWQDE